MQTDTPLCVLNVKFFGFDSGPATVTVEVVGIAPTGGGTIFTSTTSEVLATRQRGNTLSLTKDYDLTGRFAGITPAAQGFHLRVIGTVTSNGRPTKKTKIEWMQCAAAAPGAPAQVGGTSQLKPSVLGVSFVRVAGTQITRGDTLPATGSDTVPWALFAFSLIGLGISAVRGSREQS